MPTNTSGGTTTSFINSPQAVDDSYSYSEDWLRESSLYNIATKTVTLDVMSDDLGGNAKTLVSIDDGNGNVLAPDFDLLTKDVDAFGCSAWEMTPDGNWIRINNGKIEFKIGDGSNDPANALDLNSLGAGQCIDDEFVYAIRLANGTLSQATVRIHITGENDAVVLGPVTDASITDNAADDVFPDITGTLTSTDPDLGDIPTYGVDGAVSDPSESGFDQSLATTYGTLYLNSATGAYKFIADNAAIQALDSDDAPVALDFTVSVSDGNGSSDSNTLTITVTGANDDVELGAVTDASITDTVADDIFSDITGSLTSSDRDAGDSATYGVAGAVASAEPGYDLMKATAYGKLYLNSSTGAYKFVADNAATQALDSDDAPVALDFTVSVSDGDSSDSDTLTITITGANDAPVSGGNDSVSGTEDDASIGGTVPAATDVDGDALTYQLVSGSVDVDGNPALDGTVTFNANGSYSYDPSGDQDLDDGESRVVTFSYVANDGDADSAPATVTITVHGVNDAPELTGAAAVLPAGSEDNSYTVTLAQLLQGWTDVDVEALSVTGLTATNGTVVANLDGSYTITPSANYNGPVTLNYNVTDGDAPVATSLSYTLAAVNDPAAISGAISGSVTEDAVSNTVGGDLNSTDVDGVNDAWNAVASATASANGYGTYTIDAAGNWVYTLNNANPTVNALNTGSPPLSDSFTVTTADGTSQVVNITINGHTDVVAVILPPTFTGTGDPNDFDNLGNPAGQNLSASATNGNDVIYGGAGSDTINGGSGDDTIYGGSGGDSLGGGNDGDHLYGGSGSDTVNGGNIGDTIIGGFGADTLTGGAGNDTFVYLDVKDTNDTITDFTPGDHIDFSAIDANGALAGDQGFAFGGTTATAHGVWYAQVGGNVVVYMDTDGDVSTAELSLTLSGVASVGSGDFLLGP